VIESDVLKVDLAQVAHVAGRAPKIRVVGNLPYNISTPILFHLLDHAWASDRRPALHAAKRSDRPHGGHAGHLADYGRLSVMLQWRYAMENVLFVPPESV
jgi:16S rRNA (adenine1518-N6/adenine1519-N6)-dimethyltransferase